MKRAIQSGWNSILRLFRFLVWYVVAIAAVFYLLPLVAVLVQGHYEALSSSAKFFSIIGFFAVVVVWQIAGMKDRIHHD